MPRLGRPFGRQSGVGQKESDQRRWPLSKVHGFFKDRRIGWKGWC